VCMRIIGIDPGIEKMGFAILEKQKNIIRLLDCGCIYTPSSEHLSRRLNMLSQDLKSILKEWRPSVAGVEQLFFSKNVKTALTVCHARGVILEALEDHGVEMMEFNPGTIKQAVTGDMRADKKQMQKMVDYHLGVNLKNDDTVDAIACGICLLSSYNRTHVSL